MNFLCGFLIVIVLPCICSKGILQQQSFIVTPGSSIVNYIFLNEPKNITKCELQYKLANSNSYTRVSLDIQNSSSVYDDFYEERIFNIGRGLCGVHITNITVEDPKRFILLATFNDNTKEKYHFTVTLFVHAKPKNETYIVTLGETLMIECLVLSQKSCILYNPAGEIVINDKKCKQQIDVTMADIGKWRCDIALTTTMESVVEYHELKLKVEVKMETWFKQEHGVGMIGCKYINELVTNDLTIPRESHCQFFSPQNKLYTIKEGIATSRYTTIGTKLNEYICQIEFKLPLIEAEQGTWICNIHDFNGYVNVITDTLSTFKKTVNKIIKIGESFDIICKVPYATDNCYIESPNGTRYFQEHSVDLKMGKCTQTFAKSKSNDIGKWTCHISHPIKSEDDIILVDVKEMSTVEALFKEVEVSIGTSAEIMCKRNTPISSCRFVDPKGTTYHLNSKKIDSPISYTGRGLEYGECGIIIRNVKKDHAGKWTCFVRNPNSKSTDLEFSSMTKLIVHASGIR